MRSVIVFFHLQRSSKTCGLLARWLVTKEHTKCFVLRHEGRCAFGLHAFYEKRGFHFALPDPLGQFVLVYETD